VADSPVAVLPESPIEKLILYFLCHNVVRLMTIRAQTSSAQSQNGVPKVSLEFVIDAERHQIKIKGTLPADPEVDLNTEMARNERDYQLGRRLNPPRRILQHMLSALGGSLVWETVGAETQLVMQIPTRYLGTKS
jgi:hypothetical protein